MPSVSLTGGKGVTGASAMSASSGTTAVSGVGVGECGGCEEGFAI